MKNIIPVNQYWTKHWFVSIFLQVTFKSRTPLRVDFVSYLGVLRHLGVDFAHKNYAV